MNAIGDLIRDKRKRKGWSQTVLGDFIGMSTATIHRIEYGEKIPTDQELELLANSLLLEIQVLQDACDVTRKSRNSRTLPSTAYKQEWDFAHPATYAGRVWIQITPLPENQNKALDITIRWGAWQYEDKLEFNDSPSLCLLHYKYNDGEGFPILLTLTEPCYVVFGKDTPPLDLCKDITLDWKRVEPYSLSQLWRMTLSHFATRFTMRLKRLING